MIGRIHSFESFGTVDGPGIRFVVFLQGCPLRCQYCHNPDTWGAGGQEYTVEDVVQRAIRYKNYFGDKGGITLSGGEPLLQAEFVQEVFSLCREQGIHTCLDTSGCLLTEEVKAALALTDRVLLDVKYTNDTDYRAYVGCSYAAVLDFLAYLDAQNISTTLRMVIIPTRNDTVENIAALRELAATHPCVDGVELLPFRKICQVKYDEMGISFPFAHLPEPTVEKMRELNAHLQPMR